MKLKLKNFRCHTNRTFEFPEAGLVNISGSSGDGKTTILSAIVYALYGKIPGKTKKPCTHGKNTCKVELNIISLGLNITRTNRPKKLSLIFTEVDTDGDEGTQHEDDIAQSIIEEKIGMTFEEFIAASYIVQRSNASVLSMTPTEQINFIEILASTNASNFKTQIKEKQKDLTNQSLTLQGELSSLTLLLEEAKEDFSETFRDFVPDEDNFDPTYPDQIRENIKENEKKISSIQKSIKKDQSLLDSLRKSEKEYKNTLKKIQSLELKLEECKEKIDSLTSEIGEEDMIEVYNQEISEKEKLIDLYYKLENLKKKKVDFEAAVKEYENSKILKLEKIKSDLSTEEQLLEMETHLDEAIEYKKLYDAEKVLYDLNFSKKTAAKKNISNIFKEIKASTIGTNGKDIKKPLQMIKYLKNVQKSLIYQNQCLQCPNCESKLILEDKKLALVNEVDEINVEVAIGETKHAKEVETTIEMIEKYINGIEMNIPDANMILQDLSAEPENILDLQKEFIRKKRVKEEFEELSSSFLPPVLLKMQENIRKDELLLEKFSNEGLDFEGINIDDLNSERDQLKSHLSNLQKNQNDLVRFQKNQKIYEREILSLKKTEHFNSDIKNIEDRLTIQTRTIVDISEESSNLRAELDQLKELESYQKKKTDIKGLEKKVRLAKTKLDKINNLLEGYIGLEDVARDAELLTLEDAVESINAHAKIYLDYFFEDPIMVRLECIKEVKSKKSFKLQMNTSIEYKGDTYGDIEELSGGERQRCDMAFLLAVSDILGGKMLLLDECLNNLDSSINTDVLGLVRDMCSSEKLVLVISHEAVKGLFDFEVSVGT